MRKSKRYVVAKRSLNAMWMVFKLVRYLGPGTIRVWCFANWGPKYVEAGLSPIELLPKGHLAVYVGESEDEKKRVLVPVTYMNHPLLGKLLEKAEGVYGFDHLGVITIPCGISEFEKVQKVIATTAPTVPQESSHMWGHPVDK